MAINEKKPLFVRIAGERQPNLLPVTASAVGFDFNRDRFVFYHTASDDWTDISPDGVDFVGAVYADNFFSAGVVTASLGFSGSLTQLADGTSYLIAGPGILITSASNGAITIESPTTPDAYWQSDTQDVIFTTGSAQLTGTLYVQSSAYISGALWQGQEVLAAGTYSHAEGSFTTGSGFASHAEGGETTAIGIYSHAEGYKTIASGSYSHAEGHEAYASGSQSHAEGFHSLAVGISSHAEGFFTTASADDSHSEGFRTITFGYASHAEGSETIAQGEKSHAEGQLTLALGPISHAEGYQTTASVNTSHAEGGFTNTSGTFSHAEGYYTITYGVGSHAEGYITTASGDYSHAQGSNTHASASFSHAAGGGSITYGESSHAEGGNTIAYGFASHTEGFFTTTGPAALGAHAEGAYTNANGSVSHTEGAYTLAEADASHAEGYLTTGSGIGSHSEGYLTHASASYSHAGGIGTIASGSGQTAIGSYNVKGNDFSLFVIGDGTDDSNRSDILRVNPGVSAGVGRVEVSGTLVATWALSGSLTQLSDGTSYLIAGTNISITSESNGAVTITSTGGGSGDQYWISAQNEALYTTGSALFRGPGGTNTSPADFGADTFFYVSGSIGSKDSAVTGTAVFGGDVVISGTLHGGSPLKIGSGAVVTGALEVTNYLALNPYESSQVPIGTTDSAYLFASGALGKLYFGSYHDEDAEEQKISLDWIKGGSLHTGLLYGGRLTTAVGSTTFSITSGSGLIVRFRTSDTKDPYPFVKQVTWDNFISQSLTYVTSSQLSYIGIDISGSIVQQPFPFTPDDRNNVLTIGRISHPTLTTAQLANMFPDVAYGSQEWHDEFTRAFGPLKISGHTLTPSGSSLRVNKAAGSAYIAGGNYFYNSDRPNSVLDTEDTEKTNLIYVRLWVSGTDLKIEANPPTGFTALDPNNYNLDGTKTAVPSGSFSVQRLYWIPRNSRDVINTYYGSEVYSTLGDAVAGITTENFVESDNSKTSNIFLGYVAVQSGSTDLSDPLQAKIIQGGLSRNVAGGGGAAGTGVVVPGGLPNYVQYNLNGTDFGGEADFTYNPTTNLLTVGSASFGGDGELSTTATTFNLLDTTAQTINFGGAATAIDVGSTAGTTTLFGSAKAPQGLSGSLTQLTDGTSYLIAGANVTITSASNGAVTISSTGGGGSGEQYWFSTGSNEIYTTGTVLVRAGLSAAPTPSLIEFDISGSEYTQYAPYRSAPFTSAGAFIAVKNVDVADPGWSAASGSLNIQAATVFASGSGGEVLISAGAGGYSSGSNAGFGGSIFATAGEGGSSADPGFLAGLGGGVALQGGIGGAGYTIGGQGGSIAMQGGYGGDKVPENTSEPFHGAPGGLVEIVGGPGANGINSDGPNSVNRVGGTVKIIAGVGGFSNGFATGEEAAGGEVWIEGAPISAVSSSISGSLLSVGGNYQFRAISINNNPTNTLNNSPDTFFFVSGGIGERGGAVPRISAFGGDLHVSGALSVSQNIFAESGVQVAGGLVVTGTSELVGNVIATAVSASSVVSGSKVYGDVVEVNQYLRLNTGIEFGSIPVGTSNSAFMFVSGANHTLHFAHYDENENQTSVTDIHAYDGNLQTGLRWGGFLSAAPGATTFSITSGSGQIVRYNTAPNAEPEPFVKYVEWPNIVSQSITNVLTSQFTYVAIDENGGVLQQTVPYTLEGSGDVIFLGRVNHVNSVAQNAIMLPETTYGQVASFVDYARAFGPLKISGHVLSPSGSSLRVTKTGGDSFIIGGNYLYNQDRPSYITSAEDGDKLAPLFVYLYTSGSTLNALSNAGAGYPVIDPNQFNSSGTLTALPSGTFTNLRVYHQPRNLQGYLSVYYGPNYYSTLAEAANNLDKEPFEEHPTSKLATVLCGYITVQSGSTDLSNTSQAQILQGGLFRSSVGLTAASAGGGGGGTPGGSDTYVQFNQGGTTFAGDAQFTYNSTTNVLTVGNAMVGGTGELMGTGLTFDLLDSTVQTINFGGAATTIDVGSTGGTNTLFGATKMPQGLSGSLTQLTDGSSYLIGGTGIQITSASNGAVTIENAGITAVTAGTGLTGGGTSGAVTLNINDSVVATISGSTFTGAVKFNSGLSGSLTQLTDGSSYLIAGENTQVVSGSNGAITISTPSYVFRKVIYLLG